MADILNYIEQLQLDIILLDQWLSADEKGSDHCRDLKASTAAAHIPVLMVSACTPLEHAVMEAGAVGCTKNMLI